MLTNEKGEFLDNTTSIMKHVKGYYTELFSSDKTNNHHMQQILRNFKPFHFEEEMVTNMEKEIEVNELHEALLEMNRDKAPGLDGLTVEFYVSIWEVIKNDFVELVNYCKFKKRLPNSMKHRTR